MEQHELTGNNGSRTSQTSWMQHPSRPGLDPHGTDSRSQGHTRLGHHFRCSRCVSGETCRLQDVQEVIRIVLGNRLHSRARRGLFSLCERVLNNTRCRNIRKLRQPNCLPTNEELHEAALQFVHKVSGYRVPSRANQAAFEQAVGEIAASTRTLFKNLNPK